MKKISKSFLLLTALIVIFLSTVFADSAKAKVSFSYDYDTINDTMEAMAKYFSGMSDVELEYYIANYVGMNKAAFESIKAAKEKGIGDYVNIEKCNIEEHKDDLVAESLVHFEKKDVVLTAKFQYVAGDANPVDIQFEVQENEKDKSMAGRMANAGLNTLMGMGTVILVLIFLSLVISLFRFISKVPNKKEKTQTANISVETAEDKEEELVDDLELVAVITAAIAASEETSTEGFVVRSIKRSSQNKWKNAR